MSFALFAVMAALPPGDANAALRAWEPKDYVRDASLALHFDGIRNAGAEADHASDATTWKDLSGNGRDATLTAGSGSQWNDAGDGFYFNKNAYFTTSEKITLGKNFTIQFLTDFNKADMSANGYFLYGHLSQRNNNSATIYYHKNYNQLLFRTDNNTGIGWNTAIIDSVSTLSYFTAMRNGSQAVIFPDVQPPSSWKQGTKDEDNIPSDTWRIGADNSGSLQVKGTIKSIRAYTRLLSDDELAWNRAVDDARFFGASVVAADPVATATIPDAYVTTGLSGAEGSEASGAYVVDDEGYTFTAPAVRTVGGVAYALAGCSVAKWDAAAAAWGAAETRDGIYAVAVSSGDKVKITWQWAAASGTLGNDVSGYVTDNILFHFDGIRNAGADKPHDAAATKWIDLAKESNAATFYTKIGAASSVTGFGEGDTVGEWTSDGFVFRGSNWFYVRDGGDYTIPTHYTVQMLLNLTPGSQPDNQDYLFLGKTAKNGSLWFNRGLKQLQFYLDDALGTAYGTRPQITQDALSYVTAVRDGNRATLFTGASLPVDDNTATEQGWFVQSDESKVQDATTTTRFTIGGNHDTKGSYMSGTVKSVRFYNAVLDDAALARNRAIDDYRFFGKGAPATGAVIVESAIKGVSGREADGLWFPDGWTFSSGVATQTVRGVAWAPAGYQVQTWDAASGAWGAQETVLRNGDAAVEYTSPSGTDFASVRLTWLWKPVAGVRTAADYALADYAQGNLAWHLDGLAHGDSATVWADLSGHGRDATLAGDAAWATDGLVLGNTDLARTAETWKLGKRTTTEVAFDVDFAKIPSAAAQYVFVTPCKGSATDGYGALYYKLTNRHIIWRTGNLNGTGWDTCAGVHDPSKATYLTAIRDGSKTAVLTGTTYPTQTNVRGVDSQLYETWADGGADKVIDAYAWEVGRWSSGNYSIPGTIKSVRQYDRLLTEEELAWNRNVDAARYFGALATTNVVVAGKFADTAAAPVAGTYQVFGETVFKASETTHPDTGDALRVTGYVLEVWDETAGAWGARRYTLGDAYTYTKGASPAKIRLIWRWTSPGLTVIVR